MGTHIPTSAPANTTFAYMAREIDNLFIQIFNQLVGFQIDASGNTAGRATHDGEAAGFVYYDSQAGFLYQKQSATSADWSDGLTLVAALQNVVEDTTPQLGGNLDANGFTVTNLPSLALSDAATAPSVELDFADGTPTNADELGKVVFPGRNNAAEKTTYAEIAATLEDVADGSEDGGLNFKAMMAGALSSVFDFTSAGFRLFGAGVRISSILDDDNMAADSATALATQQSIKAYADTKVQMVTGEYTGDGTATKAITGLGFQPKYLKIWESEAVSGTSIYVYETTAEIIADVAGGGSVRHFSNTHQVFTDRIVSLDSDGFTVGDADTSNHPNSNGQIYNYMAMG